MIYLLSIIIDIGFAIWAEIGEPWYRPSKSYLGTCPVFGFIIFRFFVRHSLLK